MSAIPAASAALQKAVRDMSLAAAEARQIDDPQALAVLLAFIRGLRQELWAIEGFIEVETAHKMPDKRMEWNGGVATKHRAATHTSWDNDDLARVVARHAAVDEATGELPGDDVYRVVSKVTSAFVNTCGIAYWRKGQLGLMGIDWTEYAHSEPGRWKVEVDVGEPAQGDAA